MSYPILSAPIYSAIIGSAAITALLGTQSDGAPSVLTNRPPAPSTTYPILITDADVSGLHDDLIASERITLTRDVMIYGQNVGTQIRAVEQIAALVHDLFHHKREAITVAGWGTVNITCGGIQRAPTDDDQTVGRMITVSVTLAE